MSRATKAEIRQRVDEVRRLLCDCLTFREIRSWTTKKTAWGGQISEAQLKRYIAKAHLQIEEAGSYQRDREVGAAKLRYELAMARAASKGDLRAYIAANKGLCELLGLPAPTRLEHSGAIDTQTMIAELEEDLAREIADGHADS
jgi:hypothetical protein